MKKNVIYICLWIFSIMISALVFAFPSQEMIIYPICISMIYKFLIGIPGIIFRIKDKSGFIEAKRANKKALVPFYIIAVFVLQIVLIMLFMVITSSKADIASGSLYAIAFTAAIALVLWGTFCWEVEFLNTVENKGVRILFSILTPVLLFGFELTMAIIIAENQPPKYAAFTAGSVSRSLAFPLFVISPVSRT